MIRTGYLVPAEWGTTTTEELLVNESSNRPVRKFNPGMFQSDEEIVRQFVVRTSYLDTVLKILLGNIDASSCQHITIIAPRGQGKTMLLGRIAAELRMHGDFSKRLLPVRFMEENQEIFTIADFWLETLFRIAMELGARDPDLSQELQRTHASLADRWSEKAIAEHARDAVLSVADRMGKKLVVMVENLQALSGDVDEDFGWALRYILQSEPRIMLVATATSHFKGLGDGTQPFFGLFRTLYLSPLQTEECELLWQVVSDDKVNRRSIRPLEILTGGSPRLLVIVSSFARHRSLRLLMEELVTLVDEHTEYFRSQLEALPKNERRTFAAVLDLWQSSSSSEIATRARMESRIVSVMLGRLVDRGMVKVEGSGRQRLYSAAERLYCIYYQLRRKHGEEEGIVRNLLRFMVAFYEPSELMEMFNAMSEADPEKWPATHKIIEEVLAEGGFVRVPEQQLLEIEEAYREQRFAAVIELTNKILPDLDPFLGQAPEMLRVAAVVYFLRALAYDASQSDMQETIAAYDKALGLFGDSDDASIEVWAAKALVNRGYVFKRLGDVEAALLSYDEAFVRFVGNANPEIQEAVAKALVSKGHAYMTTFADPGTAIPFF